MTNAKITALLILTKNSADVCLYRMLCSAKNVIPTTVPATDTAVMQPDEFQQIEEERQQTEMKKAATIIEKCFQGSFSKFLSAFSTDRKLTQKEFEDLKEWVKCPAGILFFLH